MADSFIQLAADSTGKKVDTRTEATNSEHRQVMVIGDPATNAGVAPVDATKGLAVDLTNTGQNSTALKVDGSAVTQPTSIADGSNTTFGAKADAKSTATDTTAVSAMSVLKEISFMAQNPAALPVNQSVNVSQFGGSNVVTGIGSSGVGVPRVTLSNDSTVVPNTLNSNGTITASNSVINANQVQNFESGFIPITVHGTYAGVSFGITVSEDNGTTYYNVPIYDTNNMRWLSPGTTITPGTNVSNVYFVPNLPNGANMNVKIAASAYTSGTANIRVGGGSFSNVLPGSFMSQIMDAAGNARGANVNASNQLSVSLDGGTGSTVTLGAGSATIGALTANQSVNVAQIAGNTTSTAATGVQKVGVVGNAGAIFDGATGAAVPANAIQVGISDGTNLQPITSNSTTYTSKHAVDVNILGTLGTAFSTAGKVDVKSSLADNQSGVNSFTITLASLASNGVPPGVTGRQSTLVDNTSNLYIGAKIYLKIKAGTTPTANTLLYVFLIQYDNSAVADDGAGTTDAAFTQINATPLGTILCNSTTTGNTYTGIFDTTKVVDSLGPKWGIAVVNNWGSALDSTEGNHIKNWIGIKRSLT